jgi:hypothetical protein
MQRTTRPFTDDERLWIERNTKPIPPLSPAAALGRWLFVRALLALAAIVLLRMVGQSRLSVVVVLFLGVVMGDAITRAWNAASERERERLNALWAEVRARWVRAGEGGVMELRSAPVVRYATLDTGYDDRYLVQISESEVLCLFLDTLPEIDPEAFPGTHLELSYIPFVEVLADVASSGESQEPVRTLFWEDFDGFSSPDSLYKWLEHGKIYATTLDRIEKDLIALDQ